MSDWHPSDEEFDQVVADALDAIPDEIRSLVHNVVVLVEEWPPAEEPQDLLGLYDGVALTERAANHTGLPDRILLFRQPLVELCRDRDELVTEIEITVVHEVAHHFGIDDVRLHELGYA